MKILRNNIPTNITCLALSLTLCFSSCTKEYQDPSRAKTDVALGTQQGLTAVAIGLQRVYTLTRTGVMFNSVAANGFVTNELRLLNSGNIPELQLSTGGSTVDGTNTILFNLWTSANKIIYDADLVIANAGNLGDKGYAAGLIAYSSIFKALAIGNMAQYWEKIPDGTGKNVTFITRSAGFTKAIAVLDNALTVIAANSISASFLGNIPSDVNIINTIHALKARYALFSGNYPLALTEANAVDLTKASFFKFDATSPNILFSIISSNNVFQPLNANLGLTGTNTPDAADKRIAFYTVMAGATPTLRMNGFAAATASPFPIYLPGEMILIKAEALARQPDLTNSLIELNKVVTKTSDLFGVTAALPPLAGPYTQQQLLDLIYKHRSIELYASGLKIEDMRRFNQPLADRKRNFFPYPFQERDNNTNTPADPTF
ncbi:RagB/SusD family nutrient uptake outer membrane protein [Pedobacter alluvionis]|uniref:RagB/SusD family nutrient uptake outer membrane protein n=1 Tax=Pedobacter alluvionis TaxID=475253 RepID=A0A497Y036_9SPHI|nr:RagB/SusD family nutrient uptake outer membrane protein [Pedobacter alluvionis]RLJ73400.1 SusD-like starch-binding protein associating with outer membrane [Pedobacter alluvionis]TFB32957.1 RagB/SusD family nutrient uptake outer membrane protein [Pedobacter alluvionis]